MAATPCRDLFNVNHSGDQFSSRLQAKYNKQEVRSFTTRMTPTLNRDIESTHSHKPKPPLSRGFTSFGSRVLCPVLQPNFLPSRRIQGSATGLRRCQLELVSTTRIAQDMRAGAAKGAHQEQINLQDGWFRQLTAKSNCPRLFRAGRNHAARVESRMMLHARLQSGRTFRRSLG